MSEWRTPSMRWVVDTMPRNSAKKHVKIRFFPASYFLDVWQYSSKKFFPRLPSNKEEREEILKNLYRITINDKWHKERAEYDFFTVDEVYNRIVRCLDG